MMQNHDYDPPCQQCEELHARVAALQDEVERLTAELDAVQKLTEMNHENSGVYAITPNMTFESNKPPQLLWDVIDVLAHPYQSDDDDHQGILGRGETIATAMDAALESMKGAK